MIGSLLLAAAGVCAAALSWLVAPGLEGAFGGALAALMFATAFVDRRTFQIPDALNLCGVGLGFARLWAGSLDLAGDAATAVVRGAAFAGALWLVRFVYWRLRGRHGLGLGDVKLAFVGGVWIGAATIPLVLESASVAALAIHFILPRLSGARVQWDRRIAFGAFLAPSIWLGWALEAWRWG